MMKKNIYMQFLILIVAAGMVAVVMYFKAYEFFRYTGWLVDVEYNYNVDLSEYEEYFFEIQKNINERIEIERKKVPNKKFENLDDMWYKEIFNVTKDDEKIEFYVVNEWETIRWKKVYAEKESEIENAEVKYILNCTLKDKLYKECYINRFTIWTEGRKYVACKIPIEPEHIFYYDKCENAAIVVGFLSFIMLLLLGIRHKIKYIRYLTDVLEQIAKGKLDGKIQVRGQDELAFVAESIINMQTNINKRIEDERENAKRTKTLITNVSHDLKTPITIIGGYLDIVLKDWENEQNKEHISRAYDKTMNLSNMVKHLLELAKEENLKEEMKFIKFDFSKMIQQFLVEYQMVVEEENKRIVWDIQKNMYIEADVLSIAKVLQNVLENALKYSLKDSEINVKAFIEEEYQKILIEVSNYALPMTAQELVNIFDEFYRGDKARNSKIEGNGLGLSIVKNIIEEHNGYVWAEYKNKKFYMYIRMRVFGGKNGSNTGS